MKHQKKNFYCVTTHNPNNLPLGDIISKDWEILGKTKTTRPLLDTKIIFGLRRNKNLSDQLVRASTSHSDESKPPLSETTLCHKKLITCRSCGIQYVGQTENKLLTIFQSHHFDDKHNNDTTVARHFNKCPPPPKSWQLQWHGNLYSKLSPPTAKLSCEPGIKGKRRETLDPPTIQCCPQRFKSLRLILCPSIITFTRSTKLISPSL